MEITRETARYVAKLSKLELPEEEIDSVCEGLSSILSYMDEINASIDTDTVSVRGAAESCPTRTDTVRASMERDALLSNAPQRSDETLIVPRVVE